MRSQLELSQGESLWVYPHGHCTNSPPSTDYKLPSSSTGEEKWRRDQGSDQR